MLHDQPLAERSQFLLRGRHSIRILRVRAGLAAVEERKSTCLLHRIARTKKPGRYTFYPPKLVPGTISGDRYRYLSPVPAAAAAGGEGLYRGLGKTLTSQAFGL